MCIRDRSEARANLKGGDNDNEEEGEWGEHEGEDEDGPIL